MLYEAVERLDALMAIGEKRGQAKAEARARGERTFAFTDQRIHSFQTRSTYQDVIMRFLKWCRVHFGLNRLADIDVRADELSCTYLKERITQQYSAWTLQTERAALRLFFQRRDLAASVVLPLRHLNAITRSRHPVERDRHIQPEHWRSLIDFCLGCGLRREEVRDVRVRDVYRRQDGALVVQVVRGKGGKWREAPVLPEQEAQILAVIAGRKPEEHIFPHLPQHLDIHACRRTYAQHFYQYLSGQVLPVPTRRLRMSEVNRSAALQVSQALGHKRIDVVLLHYLK